MEMMKTEASMGRRQQGPSTSRGAGDTTVKRSSRFRGVSRWTGRYEAHLWDKLSWNVTQKKKGKQVYLGAYDDEESAARAYDLPALKYWGFHQFSDNRLRERNGDVTKEDYLASLRRYTRRGCTIEYRGINAVTNLDLSSYMRWLKPEATIAAEELPSVMDHPEKSSFQSNAFNAGYVQMQYQQQHG